LLLRSSSSPSMWLLSLPGTVDLSYLDVKDSQASGTQAACTTNCTDSGNNTGWLFGASSSPVSSPSNSGPLTSQQKNQILTGFPLEIVGQSFYDDQNTSVEFPTGDEQGENSYWIPYGEQRIASRDNGVNLNLLEAGQAVKEPWGIQLLPLSMDSHVQ